MIWRVMLYEPRRLDLHDSPNGRFFMTMYVLLEILPTAKLCKRKLLVVANNVSTTFLKCVLK